MSEQNTNNTNPNENLNTQNPTPDGAKNTENQDGDNSGGHQDKEHMIPKHRFDEVNSKYKELMKDLETLKAEKTERDKKAVEQEKKAKEQQGKFEELYKTTSDELNQTKETYSKATERVVQLEGVINSLLEARLENVPEEFKDLLPQHMNPEQKLEWLANAEKKGLFKTTKKDTPLGERTNPQGSQNADLNKLSPMELLRAAYGQK
ncbi:ribonucleoside-triphosphate reductase [Desulfotomaculum arcticum]|uniref:Ribonucleoside-triphosphate reductase n=1 Tax=Desulfotruncus arcticus DSM 17038 TaxID=1121424 RepID=A0A1I2YBS4_9FIRM|nr:OmpH family outer membrane protein [Desulfotruncus arcticus]SFH23123.1 ribonucleoside-triphosphate reductase [Desulfotomaculum arcticum] [Desulfotruncus arcticus DSM 17038]